MRPRPRRRGYAMIAVVMFVVLFLGLWTIAARQIESILRIEKARAARITRDADILPARIALGRALIGLQEINSTGAFSVGQKFQCGYDWTDDRPAPAKPIHHIVVTFTLQAISPSQWLVEAEEKDSLPPLPPLNPSLFTPQ